MPSKNTRIYRILSTTRWVLITMAPRTNSSNVMVLENKYRPAHRANKEPRGLRAGDKLCAYDTCVKVYFALARLW